MLEEKPYGKDGFLLPSGVAVLDRIKKIYQTRYKWYANIARGGLHALDWFDYRARVIQPSSIERLLGLSRLYAFFCLIDRAIDVELTGAIYAVLGTTQKKFIAYLLADRMLRHRDYSQKTADLFAIATSRNCEIHANLRYADFLVQRNGFSTKALVLPLRRLAGRRLFRHLTKLQRMRVLIFCLQQRNLKRSKTIASHVGFRYLEKNPGPLYLMHYGLIHGWLKDRHSRIGSTMYRNMQKSRKTFEQWIRQNPRGFCVVGNAPTELGTSNGAVIDGFDIVIRMNDYGLDNEIDYGKKQTVWVRVANQEVICDHSKMNSLVVFASNNFVLKRRDAYRYVLPLYLSNVAYTVIPPHIFQELIRRLDALPSTGVAVLYWIYKISGKIPRSQIFGFSHLSNSRDFRAHYFTQENSEEIGVHLHEWDKETSLLNEITSQEN